MSTFEEILERDGVLTYTNVGVSMLPLIHEGKDVMIIRRLSGKPKKYDAVLFRRPNVKGRGAYVMHRILRINRDNTYYIVGDNCLDGETVKEENILGVLTGLSRKGKQIELRGVKYALYMTFWIKPYHVRFFVKRSVRFAKRCLRFVYRRTVKKITR